MAITPLKRSNTTQAPPRKKKAKAHAEESEELWLISYADMMTLLCVFFIMMFSMSTIKKPKYEKVSQALAEHIQSDYVSEKEKLAQFVTQVIDELGIKKEVTIDTLGQGVTLVFRDIILFDTLSAYIREPGQGILNKIVDALNEHQKKENKSYKLVIEGHTDARPILGGLYPSNWELSNARATSIMRFFLDKGFNPINIIPIGYGDTRPRHPSRDVHGNFIDENLTKNRRVVLQIFDPSEDAIPWNNGEKVAEEKIK